MTSLLFNVSTIFVGKQSSFAITHVVKSPARITDVVVRLPQNFVNFDFQSSDISNILFTSRKKVSPKNSTKDSQLNYRLINQSINHSIIQPLLFISTSYEILWGSIYD